MNVVGDRFLRYTRFNTRSDGDTGTTPSTGGQILFARFLANELCRIGLSDIYVDDKGYLMATLPANIQGDVPVIGFIAHLDTSPDFTGENVKARVLKNYHGGEITLDTEKGITMSPREFPELLQYVGQDIITTDGSTLLGADDKAGIAEIVTAMEYLMHHPGIKHGKIRICFTPDEEIGQGADNFDVAGFGADFAYTIDGGEIGGLEYDNFNAALVKVLFAGRNLHPGYGKNKLKNSITIANQFISMLPRGETPENTDGYDGFYHLTSLNGDVEKTGLTLIIRDFDKHGFAARKREIVNIVGKINAEYGVGTAELETRDQYYNMREKIEPVIHVVELAKSAMIKAGVTPVIRPTRGGTDGARLSYMGLPTPNIFTGGHNFHGRFEFIPVPSMEKAVAVILNIIEMAPSHDWMKR